MGKSQLEGLEVLANVKSGAHSSEPEEHSTPNPTISDVNKSNNNIELVTIDKLCTRFAIY